MFDLRHAGDGYFDLPMERAMLTNRVAFRNFFVPNSEDLCYSLLYHALVHKPSVSNTYKNYFLANNLWSENRSELVLHLSKYLKKYSYRVVPTNDRLVEYNEQIHVELLGIQPQVS
jgi:hypothetical protein